MLVNCLVCGKEVSTKVRSKAVCSRECKLARRRQLWRKANPAHDGNPIYCGECGQAFVPNKYIAYKARFCSVSCKDRAKSRSQYHRHREKNLARSTAWRIHNKWSGNWYAAMRRDDFKCTICGSAEHILVHHRDGEGETGSNNHSMDNLKTLCLSCHTKIHRLSLVEKEGRLFVSGSIFDLLPAIESLPVVKLS